MRMTKWQTGITAGTFVGVALALGATGCKSNTNQQPAQVADLNNAPDPAAANMAPVSGSGTSASSTGSSGQTAVMSSSASAPQSETSEQYQNQNQGNFDQQYSSANYDADNDQSAPVEYAQQAPPPLPEYQQPELTEPGYIWTPGYWAWGSQGYYWVPGAWVAPPYQDALWTPGYWGYDGGRYGFHRGYWARHIGFYGGINYGFGYVGVGYQGGYWNGNNFYYNNSVNRVNLDDVHYVYQRNVPDNSHWGRVSYNGPTGVRVAPRPAEIAVLREQRMPPMQVQQQRVQQAARDKQNFYSENHGKPAVAAVNEHLAADRTPPAAIQQHAGPPAQAQRGGFGQPGTNQRQEQVNQQHTAQVQQQAREQQQHVAPPQQRQQEAQRRQPEATQRPQPQARPETRPQPQARPEQQVRPEARPQPQVRPQEQASPQPQARPQEQARPEPQAHPQPQSRPQEHARSQPAAHPQEQHPAPHPQEKPKH